LTVNIEHIKGHQQVSDELTAGNNVADELADYKCHEVYHKDLPDNIWEKVKSNKNN
jgi:hypothetical protein